jgi:hypothetical protein
MVESKNQNTANAISSEEQDQQVVREQLWPLKAQIQQKVMEQELEMKQRMLQKSLEEEKKKKQSDSNFGFEKTIM